jgi:hypothetical protein
VNVHQNLLLSKQTNTGIGTRTAAVKNYETGAIGDTADNTNF